MASATRALLMVMAAFEAVALARVHLLGHPVSAVVPLLSSAANEPSFVLLWTWMAAVLCVVRASQLAAMNDRRAWRTLALIHIIELAYFVAELCSPTSASGRALLAAGGALLLGDAAPLVAIAPVATFIAGVVLNAAAFTYCWLSTPAGKVAGTPKAAPAKRD